MRSRIRNHATSVASAKLVLLALGAVAGLPGMARGQGADTGSGSAVLPQISVEGAGARVPTAASTATRTDTPIIETPQSISVVPREQMDAQNAQSVNQALRYVAGIVSEPRPGRYDTINLRGFGGFGNDANYVSFLDGMRLLRGQAYAIPTIDPWLLDRIEVLRGPSAVMFGQVNPGGVVNQVSRWPVLNPVNEVFIEGGSYNRLQAGFDIGGRIDPAGEFTYRIAGIGRASGSQWDDVMEYRAAIAPSITWRPTERTNLTLYASYMNEPDTGYYNNTYSPTVLTGAVRQRVGQATFNIGDPSFDRFSRTQTLAGWHFEHSFDEVWTVRQNFRYMRLETDFQAVTRAGSPAALATLNRTGIMARTATASAETVDGYNADAQVVARFNTGPVRHVALAGIDYQGSSSHAEIGFGGAAPSLNVFAPVYNLYIPRPAVTQNSDQTYDQIGIYAQNQMSWGGLHLLIGVRQDWLDQKTTQNLTRTTSTIDEDSFSWRVGVVYEFGNGIAPFASYSTSFEPVTGSFAPQRGGQGFAPTEAEQYEVGVRYQSPSRDMMVTLSGFQITQTNVLTTDPLYPNYSVQQGEVESRGIEIEGRFNPLPGLNLVAAYTYLDAEVTRSNSVPVGNRPAGAPNHIAAAWADYTFQEGATLAGLTIGGGVRHIGSTYGDPANSFKVDSYTLVDAMARFDLGRLTRDLQGMQATLNVSNLFDKDYVAACGTNAGCNYGLRRTVIAGLRYRW